jgi:hypothetical protein
MRPTNVARRSRLAAMAAPALMSTPAAAAAAGVPEKLGSRCSCRRHDRLATPSA